MKTSYSRGHKIYYDINIWRYVDNHKEISDSRPCKKCGKKPILHTSDTGNGIDACLGYIENIGGACCGHGIEESIIMKEVNNER